MRRMPAREVAQHLGRVLRECDEFKAPTPADTVDKNRRIGEVAAALVRSIDSDFMMVIHTDQGRWGIDEPDPAGPARWYDGYSGGAHNGSATRSRF